MSAVIFQAKQYYAKAIFIFSLILCAVSSVISLIQGNIGLSFLCGCLAAFLPFCLSVYWVFFRHRSNSVNIMSVFYLAEGLKWLATLVIIALMFRFIPSLRYLAFFAGYFFALMGNVILPFLMKRSKN